MTLVIIGALFRWFESASRFLARLERRTDPLSRTRAHVARLRESGDHAQARLAEERFHDQLRRMRRYGAAMMIVGVAIVSLSALLLRMGTRPARDIGLPVASHSEQLTTDSRPIEVRLKPDTTTG